MNSIKLGMTFLLIAFCSETFAYGSSSSTKACNKPSFTQFTPVHLAVVAPRSRFSFRVSSKTNPESIMVTVKKQAVDVTIEKLNSGYLVSGTLPVALQKTYARVKINATGTNQCKGDDGWLLKVE